MEEEATSCHTSNTTVDASTLQVATHPPTHSLFSKACSTSFTIPTSGSVRISQYTKLHLFTNKPCQGARGLRRLGAHLYEDERQRKRGGRSAAAGSGSRQERRGRVGVAHDQVAVRCLLLGKLLLGRGASLRASMSNLSSVKSYPN